MEKDIGKWSREDARDKSVEDIKRVNLLLNDHNHEVRNQMNNVLRSGTNTIKCVKAAQKKLKNANESLNQTKVNEDPKAIEKLLNPSPKKDLYSAKKNKVLFLNDK